jgi:hypothetical protein
MAKNAISNGHERDQADDTTVTTYTIYLVNNAETTQTFWCFLGQPQELASQPGVYANSSTSLAVASMAPGINTFTIPVQYTVGAGAGTLAVGLNIQINSTITQAAQLGDTWDAAYATVPPNMGPSLTKDSASAPSGTIAIASNGFNQASNEAAGWFSNMSYGIQTNQGFIGMTWSPSPAQTRTITPLLQFYVAVGSYGSNQLAEWTDVANNAAQLTVPGSFDLNATTVTYTETGGWAVTPGRPSDISSYLALRGADRKSLVQSHLLLSEAHAHLVAARAVVDDRPAPRRPRLTSSSSQSDTLASVKWNPSAGRLSGGVTVLSGTITVSVALAAAFATFVLSGTTFTIVSGPAGGTTVSFTYNGTQSGEYIKSLFQIGARLVFA